MENKEKELQQEDITTTADQESQENENLEADAKAEDVVDQAEENPIEEEMKKIKREHQELKDKYLRLYAEFDNYKKRTVKEKIDLMKTASANTMEALLPVLDDFDRAKKNADADNSTEVFSEGVNLVYQKLYSALKAKGLKPMDSNGVAFDPELHEAVTEIPAPTEEMKGKVIDTIERGYFLNEKIIRYAKVVVGK